MSSAPILIDAAWAPGGHRRLARGALLAVAGSLLIAVCAHIKVPMWPVPITMQTFAVLLIGFVYGSRLGAATVALYLAEGAVGLPVFAGGGGIAHFAGPTGGYLAGFLVAAALTGWLAENNWSRSIPLTLLGMLLGSAVITLFGFAWLAALLGAEKAFLVGVAPFLVGDAVKASLAAVLLPMAWKGLPRIL
ncbi:biotin transporter BioY [Microvirga makkahensis]|uniref:Biotin transporter n=1 Tax=Microvirga makkahensis TaxID=1128670 RepID=A0A7X3MP95_9HYPH|nr:biotin transporter BioY [Microvirga makkahensis]MXQ10711.1 biotin transporter BioY [Microvirga makkahensis]